MGVIKCKNCGKELPDNYTQCTLCSTELHSDSPIGEKNDIKEFLNEEPAAQNTTIEQGKKPIKKKKLLKIIIIFLLTVAVGIGVGYVAFKITGGKNPFTTYNYANDYFSVKFKTKAEVIESGETTYFYIKKGEIPYVSITKYSQYKTSDAFLSDFIPNIQSEYFIRGITSGTRNFETIGNKMIEYIPFVYVMNGEVVEHTTYVYSTGNVVWVFTLKEYQTQSGVHKSMLNQLIKSFKEV